MIIFRHQRNPCSAATEEDTVLALSKENWLELGMGVRLSGGGLCADCCDGVWVGMRGECLFPGAHGGGVCGEEEGSHQKPAGPSLGSREGSSPAGPSLGSRKGSSPTMTLLASAVFLILVSSL